MDNKIIYVFDWDCTITTRHHYIFMNDPVSFIKMYYTNEEYKKINDKYLAKTSSIVEKGDNARGALDVLATEELEINTKKITTYMGILDQPILTYIVELLFGIHRFFALRDMFQVLHNKNIKIIIISNGVYNQIIKLLKILLYSRDDILAKIDIIARNISGGYRYLYNSHEQGTTQYPNYKSDIIKNMINKHNKVFYVDDDKVDHNRLIQDGYLQNMYYHFYDKLQKEGDGLTLDDMQYICNFNFQPLSLSGGNKSNYIKLKKYLQ